MWSLFPLSVNKSRNIFYQTTKVWGKKKVKNLEDRFGINFYPGIKLFVSTHWVNSRISRNDRAKRPKIGLFGPLYKIQTKIENRAYM